MTTLESLHTSVHDFCHSRQVLLYILLTGDLQALAPLQGHQLKERSQAVHSTKEHHDACCRTEKAGQKEPAKSAHILQHPLRQNQELAFVPV